MSSFVETKALEQLTKSPVEFVEYLLKWRKMSCKNLAMAEKRQLASVVVKG